MLQPHATMEGDILYFIEHQFLRDEFYNNTMNLLNISVENLYAFIQEVFKNNKEELKYKLEDFNIEYYMYSKAYVMIISFPKTEYVTLCDRIYLIFDPETNKKKYITIERADDSMSALLSRIEGKEVKAPEGFLCSWDENGQHINHNQIAVLDWNSDEVEIMKSMEYAVVTNLFDEK